MTDGPTTADLLAGARAFAAALPHSAALSMRVTGAGPGWVEMELPFDPRLVGDPETGVLHGGPVIALVDTCAGAAVLLHPAAVRSTATLDLRVDYMRGATPGRTVRARAECHSVTRSVAFVRATVEDGDPDRPVAMAMATFTVERA